MYLGLPTAISRYNLFPSLITLTSGGQFASRGSRILCNTLHKEREAPFSCKRTDTDRLGITEGGMNPAFRSPKTVRLKPVRAVRFPVLSARFPLSIFSFSPFLFLILHPVFFISPLFYFPPIVLFFTVPSSFYTYDCTYRFPAHSCPRRLVLSDAKVCCLA